MTNRHAHLMIAFGTVMGAVFGATTMLIAAPYLLEIRTLESGAKVPAMIEGYGDVYGGLLGGLLAVSAAIAVFWLESRKSAIAEARARKESERANAELRSILAFHMLDKFYMLHMSLKQGEGDLSEKPDLQEDFLDIFQGVVGYMPERFDDLLKHPTPDIKLGHQVITVFAAVQSGAQNLKDAIQHNSNPHQNRRSYLTFTNWMRNFGELIELLEDIYGAYSISLGEDQ